MKYDPKKYIDSGLCLLHPFTQLLETNNVFDTAVLKMFIKEHLNHLLNSLGHEF